MAKKGLGKGLGSLIADAKIDVLETSSVVDLKLIDIEPNKNQPRSNFDEEFLLDLANSIKEHGVISPIIVTKQENGFYKIVAGERRWRAAKLAKLKTIPAIIKEYDYQKSQEIALIENLQRQDLTPVEEAKGYKRLMEEFSLTQEQVSEKVSKSRPAIANALRILSLPKEVLVFLEEGKISVGHAKVLLSCNDVGKQLMFGKLVVEKGLTVRELENIIKTSDKKPKKKEEIDLNLKLAYEDFEKRASSVLGTKVKVSRGKKKGKIEIEYYSTEDLERIRKTLKI